MTEKPLSIRIDDRPVVNVAGPQIAPAVTAAPVADVVRAAPVEADGLLQALSSLNPALAAWTTQETAVARQEGFKRIAREEEGEAVRGQQLSMAGGVLPQEAHPAFVRGYMANEGFKAGRQDSVKLFEAWNAEADKPDFDVDRFTQKWIADNTKGLDDQDYLKSYIGQVGHAVSTLQSEQSRKRLAALQASKEESKDQRIRSLFTDAGYDAGTFWNGWNGVFKSLREQGFAPDDLNNSFTKQAITEAYEKLDIGIIDRALETPNGVGPAVDPTRRMELLKARSTILEALKKAAGKEFSFARAQAQDAAKAKLEAGDVDINIDPAQAIAPYVDPTGKDPTRFITTEAEYTSWLGEYRRAQDKKRDEIAVEQNYDRDPRIAAGTPEGEKYVKEKVYAPIWKDHTGTDPADTMARVQKSLGQMARNGVPDPMLKSFVSVSTMDVSKGITPEFQTAVDVYEAARKQNAMPALQRLMSDADIRIMSEFTAARDAGHPVPEAARVAARLADPMTQEQVNTKLREPGSAEAIRKGLKKITEPWFGFNDSDPLALEVPFKSRVRQLLGNGMTLDGAVERATTEFEARSVSDGNRGRFLLPNNPAVLAERASYEKNIPALIVKATAAVPDVSAGGFDVIVDNDGSVSLRSRMTGQLVPEFTGMKRDAVERVASADLSPTDVQNVDSVIRTVRAGRLTDAASHEALRTLNDAYLKNPRSIPVDVRDRVREQAHRARYANTFSRETGAIPTPAEQVSAGDLEAVSVAAPNPPGPFPKTSETVRKLMQAGDLTTALTIGIETISPTLHIDANGKQVNIGAGMRVSGRDRNEVRLELRAAGVPDHMVDSVMAGNTPLDERQAVKLTKNALEKKYLPMARSAFEARGGVWSRLPPNQQAALTYLAYNTGNPAQFTTVLNKLVAQDYAGAAEALTLTYKDKNGVRHDLMKKRGGVLLKSMMQSPKAFEFLIAKGK